MNDKELLKYAAKACGLLSVCADDKDMQSYVRRWNPLEDDGASLRLASELRISIIRDSPNVHAQSDFLKGRKTKIQEDVLYQCVHKATRRAIVRAAAEIAKIEVLNEKMD